MRLVYVLVIATLALSACKSKKNQVGENGKEQIQPKVLVNPFENQDRKEWQQPEMFIAALNLQPGQSVAHINSDGYLTYYLAQAGARVWVYPQDEMFASRMQETFGTQKKDFSEITLRGIKNAPMLTLPEPVDYILFEHALGDIKNLTGYLSNVKENLKSEGKIVILEFKNQALATKYKKATLLNFSEFKRAAQNLNLQFVGEFDGLPMQVIYFYTQ